ncbi:MAG TPA: hypothetical protein VK708_02200 [Bryobacteraceae bacterium]|jgi:hypothetical protein|nr:hypothetical protein [Bryobacteraceae bacterium]
MINGISGNSQTPPAYQAQQQQQAAQTHKNTQNEQEPQDTVVLSKKATEAAQTGDQDHDGDSR